MCPEAEDGAASSMAIKGGLMTSPSGVSHQISGPRPF
jgi:hypothetical protein